MAITGLLSVIVLVAGLVIFLVCVGLSKTSAARVGEIMFFAGLLAFLLGAGAQSCGMSMGTGGGGGGSSTHR